MPCVRVLFIYLITIKILVESIFSVFSRCLKEPEKFQKFYNTMSHLWKPNFIKSHSMRNYCTITPECKYITTPIFYVNSAPHIGHLYTAVLADTISRYNLMHGHVTLLNTGTDEHGNKVLKAAKLLNLPVKNYCDVISHKFKEMCDTFDVGYTNFIRTTEPSHQETVKKFWTLLEDKDCIYKGKYSGWYCVPEEAFLSNNELIEKTTSSGEIIKVSAESGHPVDWVEEDNYKFRLSSFQDNLKYWLKDEKVIQPPVFHKILSHWVDDESIMSDLSISRSAARVPWGIPTPNDPNQTIYVWLDALVNYLTSVGYPDDRFKEFWPPTVQVIGKDILKFHGIYWPAFLIAVGLEPPKTLFCHSHWTVDGDKMSKSKGNVIAPLKASEQFTIEGLRYFLLRDSVPHNDSNYSEERILQILNSELADTLGNLVSRCTGKLVNPHSEIPSAAIYSKVLKSEPAENLRKNMETVADQAQKHYESFYIHHVVDVAMETLRSANVMIEHHKPWLLRKEPHNEVAVTELKAVLAMALEATRISALILYPIIPKLSSHLLDFLSVPIDARHWRDAKPKYLNDVPDIKSEHFTTKSTILFPKIKIQNVKQ